MRTKQLGSRGPGISVVGFGAWEAGGGVWGERPDEESIAAIQAGVDAGINWVDTAEVYGQGRSEQVVARALEGRPDVMVFTKVAPKRAGTGFARDDVHRAAEKSVARLQRESIDLYQLHWPDRSIPVEETWEAMMELVEQGVVRYAGVSNFDQDLIERCEKIGHVDSLQPHFSMLHRDNEHLFPYCSSNGTGIICYSPLAYGLLTGAIDESTRFAEDDWRSGGTGIGYYDEFFAPGKLEKNLETVAALRPIADRTSISLAQLALAWVWHQEAVTGAIAGSRSPKHVQENARAGDVDLDRQVLEEIEQVLSDR